jgi:hypothetical protein
MGQNATWIIENMFLVLEQIQDLHYCIGAYGNFMGVGLVLCVTQQWMEHTCIGQGNSPMGYFSANKPLPLLKAHVG